MIEDQFSNGTLSAMLRDFAYEFQKVSEESLDRDETPRQTSHELFFTGIRQFFYCNSYGLKILSSCITVC